MATDEAMMRRLMETEDAPTIPERCPDSGACHHGCTETCFRVEFCAPLSIAGYPGDEWPPEVLVDLGAAHLREHG